MKTTNPKDFIELLEVFLNALQRAFLDPKEIIQWADHIIAADEEPDYFFIELSLSQNSNEIIAIINELLRYEPRKTPVRASLGFLYRNYIRNKTPFTNILWQMDLLIDGTDLTDKERNFIYDMDSDYMYAGTGYGKVELIELKLEHFFSMYKEFKISNFKDWKGVHTAIDSKIKAFFDKH
jgi:hypothetical protein